jgi:hypothetical protein
MALILKDRVLESSTSTGIGSFTLTGAQTGYQSFSAIGNGNTTYYTIQGKNPDGTLTGEWEVGIGTWSTGNTLARDTVLSNSLGTTAKIVFSAGAKDVFCDYPASKSVNQNADNKVIIPYTPGVTSVGSLNVGDATVHADSGVIAAFTASEPLYLYTSLQNTSSANTSYASYAVNDGGHTSYGELGINNSNYSYTAAGFPNNTFSAPLATFVESYGGPLAIGTWDSQKISFIVNGSVNTADAMTISAAGNVSTANDITVNGLTVGRGSGNVTTNSAFGIDALKLSSVNNTNNIAIGSSTLTNLKQAGIGGLSVLSSSVYSVSPGTTYEVELVYVSGTTSTTGNYGTVLLVFDGEGVFSYAEVGNIGSGFTDLTTVVRTSDDYLGNFEFSFNITSLVYGIQNTAVGYLAGSTVSSGRNNTLIGYNAQPSQDSTTNEIVIGSGAVGKGSNSIVLGNSTNFGGTTYIRTQNLRFLDSNNNNNANAIIAANLTGNVTGSVTGSISGGTGSFSTLTATGSLQLTGSATGTHNLATNQTSGTLTIGGTGAAGAITLGRSTGAQTINIATGINTASAKVVNIGTAGTGSTTTINIGSASGSTSTTTVNGLLKQQTYTVATLPTGSAGARSFVTNALAPAFGSAVVGGGAVGVPVYHDGTSWKVG